MFAASNVDYEMAARTKAISCGGIGLMLQLAVSLHLRDLIDEHLHVLKEHRPYQESDHVLNIALNLLAGGTCLEDLELRRNDENYLDALGAERIPDPTTAGDFCRRFSREDVEILQDIFNMVRLTVWKLQGKRFFDEAVLDVDASIVETTGECKEGADFSYNGKFGYQVLVISLANTGEVLHLPVRGGNRPSHEGAAEIIDRMVAFCREAGFREVTVRGDTDYALTHEFDRWDEQQNRFVVGYDAKRNLVEIAENLQESEWQELERREKRVMKTEPRARPENTKERIVDQREYKNFTLEEEAVAEFSYRPTACSKDYRMIVLRKRIRIQQGQMLIGGEDRYFFYVTNDWIAPADAIVFDSNDRCNQENLFAQLKAARILHAPVANLLGNWAYMVIAQLAWSLKAWFALLLPHNGRWAKRRRAERETLLRMEFRTFLNAIMLIPVQIVKTGRRIVYRVLAYSAWVVVLFRAWDRIQILRC